MFNIQAAAGRERKHWSVRRAAKPVNRIQLSRCIYILFAEATNPLRVSATKFILARFERSARRSKRSKRSRASRSQLSTVTFAKKGAHPSAMNMCDFVSSRYAIYRYRCNGSSRGFFPDVFLVPLKTRARRQKRRNLSRCPSLRVFEKYKKGLEKPKLGGGRGGGGKKGNKRKNDGEKVGKNKSIDVYTKNNPPPGRYASRVLWLCTSHDAHRLGGLSLSGQTPRHGFEREKKIVDTV